LESVLGASPREFESRILRRFDLRRSGARTVPHALRARLLTAFPAAAGLFSKPHSAISLAFLARFDCQDRAGWLSEKRLAAWLKAASYSGRTSPAGLYQRRA
jgi:hypothetical protein